MDLKSESVSDYAAGQRRTGKRRAKKLQPEGVNQSRKRGWLLSPARVIKEESWEGLAPILQYADERAFREILRNLILPHEGEPYAINGGADHDVHVADDQRPIHRNG